MTRPGLAARLRTLLRRRRVLGDYDDEVAAHLELLAAEFEQRGLTPEAARREARRQFGGVDQAREAYRDASGFPSLDALTQDLRYGLRMVRRQPGFSALVVAMVAIGVGACTAILSLVSAVLLRPLPYRAPERLVVVRTVIPTLAETYPTLPVAAGEFLRFQAHAPAFEAMAAIMPVTQTLTGAGDPARIGVARVTTSLFPMLGIQPALGRYFRADEDQEGRGNVVVLSYAFWTARFGSDRTIVGRAITLDEQPYTVIGVLPEDFRFPRHEQLGAMVALPERLDAFKPAAFTEDERGTLVGDYDWAVVGRLRSGATTTEAEAQLNAQQLDILREVGLKAELKAQVIPLYEQVVGQARRGLLLLGWSVALVLLVLVVNLANLLLARVSARAHETSVRTALGASRGRVIRQVVIENLLLAAGGGVLGVALAWLAVRVLAAQAPVDLPRLDEVSLDPTIVTFGIAVSLLTGLLFSALPAWRLSRANPQTTLRASARTYSEGAPLKLRGALVAVEVALSTVLLAAASLVGASFFRLLHTERGFTTAHIVFVDVAPSVTRYAKKEAQTALYDRLLARVRALPGITSATLVSEAPLHGEAHVRTITLEHDGRPIAERPVFNIRYIDPGYFSALGISLTRGRLFDARDRGRRVAILNDRAAAALWPRQDPLGRLFRQGDDSKPLFEVVGTVGDAREVSLYKAPYLMGYVPYWVEGGQARMSLVLKTGILVAGIVPALRKAIWEVDSQVPVSEVATFQDVVARAVAPDRFQLVLVGAFAASALLLASLGIYGVPAFAVSRRSREMGIRLALGATPTSLVRLVVGQGLMPVLIGVSIGVAGAALASRFMADMLFEAAGIDWWAMAAVVIAVAAVALVACYIPARRVSRIDPAQAIRVE